MHLWNDSRAHGRPHPTSPYKNKAWLRIDVKNESGHIGRIRIEVWGYGWVTFFHGNKPSFPVRHVSGHALLDSQGPNRIELFQQKKHEAILTNTSGLLLEPMVLIIDIF